MRFKTKLIVTLTVMALVLTSINWLGTNVFAGGSIHDDFLGEGKEYGLIACTVNQTGGP